MQRNFQRKLDDALHAVKRLAATCAIAVFGLTAMLGFGAAFVQFAAETLSAKMGTWEAAKTVADTWPLFAGYVAAIEWSGLQRIALLIVAQSVVWAYLGLGIVCFVISGSLWKFMTRWSSAGVGDTHWNIANSYGT